MATMKKSKLPPSLEEKKELINIHVGTEHEIPTFQEKKLEKK
jgi:hypothetical protein